MMRDSMRAALFHNPQAGRGQHDGDEFVSILRKAGYEVTYVSTKTPHYPAALDEVADLILIAGGDGTVRKVMTRIVHRGTPVMILPLGTANNIARSLGIEGDPPGLLAGLASAREKLFDLGVVDGPWGSSVFVEGVGCGALAATMNGKLKGKQELDGRAKLAAGREAFAAAIEGATPMQAVIAIDGCEVAGEWLAIEILNNRYTGPGLMLAPDSTPGDGLLHVACLPESRRKEMIDWLRAPVDAAPMVVSRGRRVAFDVEKDWPLRLDDKECDRTDWHSRARISAQMQGRPLRVLVPAPAGNDGKDANHERAETECHQ